MCEQKVLAKKEMENNELLKQHFYFIFWSFGFSTILLGIKKYSQHETKFFEKQVQ